MMLDSQQVDRVKKHLINSGIENRLTFTDLLDHVCCMIEQEMEAGHSFDESLALAFQQLPVSKIKEIELFTLKTISMETSFSSRTSWLATIPFGLFGLHWVLTTSEIAIPGIMNSFFLILAILPMFILLGIGWVNNFPRWSIPAIGFCLLFCLFFMNVTIPSISKEVIGVWAWAPLFITLIIGLTFNFSSTPMKKLFAKIKDDPSLILFLFYGFAPFFLWLFMDETHSTEMAAIALASILILILGLYFFLRSDKKIIRIVSILLTGILASTLTIIASILYWK